MFQKLLYVTQLQPSKLLSGVTALTTTSGFPRYPGHWSCCTILGGRVSPDLSLNLPIVDGDLNQYELLKNRETRVTVLGWGLLGVFFTKAALAYVTQWSVYRFIYRVQADLRERLIQYF